METIHSTSRSRPAKRLGTTVNLPDALDAPRRELSSKALGRVAYYEDIPAQAQQTRPLLLIHSINAAPSSYEVRPIFDNFQGRRPIFSPDLPGFGHSERGDRNYSPQLYADTINALLNQVIGEPADVVALSLSAEFAARAAIANPDAFASLALISPTGFMNRAMPSPRTGRFAHGALTVPLWGQGLFDLVASRRSIRYFLNQSFTDKAPDDLIDYAYATAHQPGARHAPLTFLSTRLFSRNASDTLFARLHPLPVLAIADRDPYVTFERLPAFADARPNWYFETLAPNSGLPHWEHPQETCETLSRFWERNSVSAIPVKSPTRAAG